MPNPRIRWIRIGCLDFPAFISGPTGVFLRKRHARAIYHINLVSNCTASSTTTNSCTYYLMYLCLSLHYASIYKLHGVVSRGSTVTV
jgi:hypothetical protein